jgi:plastocyanin
MRRRAGPWVFTLLAVTACGSDGPAGSGPEQPAATNAVDVRDNRFEPPNASISAGGAVTWTWRGVNGHNVTFENGQGSSTTRTSGSHQRAFSSGGTFRYRCTIHSSSFTAGMIGSVLVE